MMVFEKIQIDKILIAGWLILLGLETLFIIHLIREVHWYGPVQDFWGSIPFIEKSLSSGIWFGEDLWVVQNGHRLALPRLSFLIDYNFFNGSNYFITGLGVVLIIAEIIIFRTLVSFNKKNKKNCILYYGVISILILPNITYNLLNTFNIQWIQCAFLALLSITLFSYGVHAKCLLWKISGIISAILCCFTTFSLTAIWPALFLILWLSDAKKSYWFFLGITFSIFSILFILILPTNFYSGNGSQYTLLPPVLDAVISSGNPVKSTLKAITALLQYVVNYLSMPVIERSNVIGQSMAALSMIWMLIVIFLKKKYESNWKNNSLIGVMFFVLCIAITTALGRAFVGDLSQGIRFHPIALLYWAAFLAHGMGYILRSSKQAIFVIANLSCLVITISLFAFYALYTNSRLTEEYNRYSRMQMAYITNNFHQNALYENLVPEWRLTSYPGILAAIPYLKRHYLGIFNQPVARFVTENPVISNPGALTCMEITITQKTRNKDPKIQNITINHPNPKMDLDFPYLLIYSEESIIAASFRQRFPFFKKKYISTWIGVSINSIETEKYFAVALDRYGTACFVKINSINFVEN